MICLNSDFFFCSGSKVIHATIDFLDLIMDPVQIQILMELTLQMGTGLVVWF